MGGDGSRVSFITEAVRKDGWTDQSERRLVNQQEKRQSIKTGSCNLWRSEAAKMDWTEAQVAVYSHWR